MPNLKETLALIDEFAALPVGWHYGEGILISDSKINLAKKWISLFHQMGLGRFNAFPEVDGGIRLRTYHKDTFFEISWEANGTVDIAVEKGNELLYFEENAKKEEIAKGLEIFVKIIWHSSEQSTNAILIKKQASSRQPYSREARTMVYRFLNTNARRWQARQSANTLESFIRTLLANQSFTGLYRPRSSKISRSDMSQAIQATNVTVTSSAGIIKEKGANTFQS